MEVNLEFFESTEGMGVGCSNDTNAILLLPKRKKAKTKVKDQGKVNEKSCLSKSQKRKLQKLEEEKKKEALLSESIKTLEKHKINEGARSLLLSSGKIGQVETSLEKRRRGIQLFKVGLVASDIDQSPRKRVREDGSHQSKLDHDKSRSEIETYSESLAPYHESASSSIQKTDNGSGKAITAEEFSNKINAVNVHKDELCNYEGSVGTKSKNRDVDDLKVDCDILADCAAPRIRTVPIVVPVVRLNEVEDKRKDLPIVMMEQEIMEAISEHSTVIICGETGCGKTTQVPQFLYEAGFGLIGRPNVRSGIIGVTQPRRVAVLATAKRVAFELGLRLGKEVGFQVRHDRRIGDNCSIKFMTDGILLRELQSDFLLKRYSIIILDEVHERSLNTDILIGMLSRIIQVRQKLYREQQEKILTGVKVSPDHMISQLKLILMSATLRAEDFVSGRKLFREPPPVIEVPTRQFPVSVHFSRETKDDYIAEAYKKVMSIHSSKPPGGILVFVTGQKEVEDLCRELRRASRELSCNNSERQTGNEVNGTLEANFIEQEIDEAFEIHGHSSDKQTDRFSAYEEDHGHLDVDDSYASEGIDDSHSNLDDKLNLRTKKTAGECSSQPFAVFGKKYQGHTRHCNGALYVLPLYAMLPARAQLRVFEEVKEGKRLIVVATNVAETSLTIPGIKYVVDSGKEKVKLYNSKNGMETYDIQWISKASAAQRAGRAGRTGPGRCYCLYSSAVFSNLFSDFSVPEISKVPVEGVILLMKSMGIDKVANFPFPTPPDTTALVEAEYCLKALEALDDQGRLTPIGKAMAKYPMSPRHSRMLLTVIQIMKNAQNYARPNLLLGYTIAAAASLSLRDPFIASFEESHSNEDGSNQNVKSGNLDGQKILDQNKKMKQKKLKRMAKEARAKFCNPTSDALTTAYALQLFELAESPVKFCNDNALHLKTMEDMSKLRKQILQLVFQQSLIGSSNKEFAWNHGTVDDVEQAWRVSYDKHPLLLHEEELLGQAICAGWVDRVAKRIRVGSSSSVADRKANVVKYQACVVKETVFLHRWSSLAQSAPELLVYGELLETKRPYMHRVTRVKSEWLIQYAGSMCTFSAPLTDPKPYYEPLADQVLCWVSPTFGQHLWQLPLHSLPMKSNIFCRVSVFGCALLEGHVLPCLRLVQKFLAASPASIMRPEALGQRRVGNLLNKLQAKSKAIDSRAMLKQTWDENPWELYPEILAWFQEGFHEQFEGLWAQMQSEVLLEPKELFPKRMRREKRENKRLVAKVS